MKKFFILAIAICRILTNSCYAVTAEQLFWKKEEAATVKSLFWDSKKETTTTKNVKSLFKDNSKKEPWEEEWISEEEWRDNLIREIMEDNEEEEKMEWLILLILWWISLIAWLIIVIKKD